MKKTLFKSVGLCALAFSQFAVADANVDFGISAPQLNAQSYILMDYNSGNVLASLNPDQRQYPASLTKMMTSYVVGDALKQGKVKNSDMVTVTENSWAQKFPGSSLMFLDLNTQVSVADLMRGLIIVSGNDAAVALAEHTSGSQQAFIDQMNKFAQQFGLKNTHFTTVHGLDEPNQYSSARDMAIIGAHIIRDQPEEYKIYAEKEFKYNIKKPQPNRNGLLWDKTMNVDGMKTGHTSQAGYNLVASATNSNTRLISVVMGVETYKGREVESKKLLQWGFANFETIKSLPAGQAVSEQSVYYGEADKVQLGSVQDSFVTVPKGKASELKARYELERKNLEAPLAKGQVIGKVIYQLDGKDVASSDLQVLQDVPEAGIFGKAWDWVVLTVKSLFD
ncbi:D-alanyl-D-alanine carboxypeptidase [Actinobacillus equuli subsp. equuli]|uniref:serine-type D-Ala-D-Ala carboxypeptidase n=3 Tax=Actinobacillus TaxID=713 RepID=A0A9X4JE34_ACTEU|nr:MULTISPECIES: D-alanyl-D-alanine carboxypeptidase family protein [Actinobacillus]AFU19964.1 D-alanyl-D-alanine carboxypeptidase [Actinobacillus suis H91-0380]AIJ32103.1 D-alanyl-D-alanine carboxypeptidase [Actinobacillus suis ATCC 33415]MCO4165989.1 D-alanyl-D-alanine carboxypeptidase [Actinobacillus suis]MCO4167908.1 D-alanyl-D-alanine carboxypeptidase [Actinobacillus suis]MCO4169374.1 D-alanyl-D-alanine carboxypeptidase [Actinobacillus suis]